MKRVTELAQGMVREIVTTGDAAVDATAGNGWDTLFLAQCVGPTGHVYSFDVQVASIEATNMLLASHKFRHATVIQDSHANLLRHVPPGVRAVMFNLGYRPGGDRSIVTRTDSTLTALESAYRLLLPGGIMTVVGYVGHPGGRDETDAVADWVQRTPGAGLIPPDTPTAPRLMVCRKPQEMP